MSVQKQFIVIMLAAISLGFGASAMAQSSGDPIIRMDSNSKMEVDLGMMAEDLFPLLLEALEAEDEESAAMASFFWQQLGLDALQLLKMESKQTKDNSTSKVLITLDQEKKDSLIYRFFTLPNGQCNFGKNVQKDQLVMFMTLHNFSSYLDIMLDFLAKPEMAELLGELPLDENGDLAIGDFRPRTDLLPLLSGELDLFILESPEGTVVSPLSAPYFLVLGSTDGFALRDKILEIASMMGGEAGGGIAEMIQSMEPELVGGYELLEFPFGGALAVNEDYLILGMAPAPMREMLTIGAGDLRVPDGLEWVYMNGPKYGAYMDSVMDMATAMSSGEEYETQLMMKVYSILFEHIETEEYLCKSRSGGLEITTEVNGPVMTGLYKLAYVMLEELPEIIEQQQLKDEKKSALEGFQDAVGMVDKAMMAYAEEHDGTYPEDPVQLYEEGYMDSFPLSGSVEPGQYMEWGYTYHALRDEEGKIEGYFFFVYGGPEGDGFDVYTPENLADPENFRIGRDGHPDRVASFCFDGTALEQADRYFE